MSALHHEIITAPGAAPSRRMLLLHGIYGAGRNWGSVARRLVRARPAWGVVLVDLRSHGRSPRMAPHTVEACADDLLRLERMLEGPADAVLGHSFGGKVALLHARRRPKGPAAKGPAQLWIIDSAPGAGRPGGGAWRMLGVLRRHPGPFGSRAEVVAAVEAEGFGRLVANWMATNAVRTVDGLAWRVDPRRNGGVPARPFPDGRVGRGRVAAPGHRDPLREGPRLERPRRRGRGPHWGGRTRNRPESSSTKCRAATG